MTQNHQNQVAPKMHRVRLDDRKNLLIEGVTDVIGFDDRTVHLLTTRGGLSIEGKDLKISDLSIERGALEISGAIVAIVYLDDTKKEKGGFFSGLFR